MILVGSKAIKSDVESILSRLQLELVNGKLRDFKRTSSGIRVPCPVHSGGMEQHPSCYIGDDGIWHCFTCGSKGGIDYFVAQCLEIDIKDARKWLFERFDSEEDENIIDLQPIVIGGNEKVKALDESILNQYQSFHPYMRKRKLSQEICERFKIKYDDKSESIVFPVWDENNHLVMVTRRCVNNKRFMIPSDVEKPVYLLNYIERNNIKDVLVVESQINALYGWSLGYPSIALFGTGTKHQYEILNKSGIRHYTLVFDGDEAGDKGKQRFISNIRKDVLVDWVDIPRGKDLNDLEENEVNILLKNRMF